MSQDSTVENAENKSAKSKGPWRILTILGLFVVMAGAIIGLRQYLEAQVPVGDEKFIRGGSTPEEVPSGLQVIGEMLAGPGDTKEVAKLKKAASQKVVFNYDQISKMSREELETNIKDLSAKLQAMSSGGFKFAGGAGAIGMGQGGAAKEEEVKPLTETELIALPLEVMRQTLKEMPSTTPAPEL